MNAKVLANWLKAVFGWIIRLESRGQRDHCTRTRSASGQVPDNVTIISTDNHLAMALVQIINEFSWASWSKVNCMKSEAMLFVEWALTPTDSFPFFIKVDFIRILFVLSRKEGAALVLARLLGHREPKVQIVESQTAYNWGKNSCVMKSCLCFSTQCKLGLPMPLFA